MAYLGLARKWRPQIFDDLIGQEHIARTLLNAIKAGRICEGYLFTGTRGVGKTSAARIFAKALRCQKPSAPGVPCNVCTDCREIAEGRATDVLEIDGASNNGVDDVREIREKAKYLPSSGKHKIYIIDEVHMLSTAAFNALLKTLEEPPAHVLFVFATTDPQKIPATILSRCQRFDFKRVSEKDLAARLKRICGEEKVEIAPDAILLLAREAEGSMRDALSLLDQILSVGQEKPGARIDAKAVVEALGMIDKQVILDCMTGILKRRPLDSLEAVGKVHMHGFDLKQLGRDLLRYLRQLMVVRLLERGTADGLSAYLDVSDVDLADLKSLAGARSLEDLDLLFRMLNHGLEDVARSQIPRMVMDALVIKMASSEELVNLSDEGGGSRQQTEDRSPKTGGAGSGKALATGLSQSGSGSSVSGLRTPDSGLWKKAVAHVKSQKPLIGSYLEELNLESIVEEASTAGPVLAIRLSYASGNTLCKDQLESRANAGLVSQLLKNHLGRAVRLEYNLDDSRQERERLLAEDRRRAVLESEAIRASQQLLGARLERLEIQGDTHA